MLINPGDSLTVSVYLTDSSASGTSDKIPPLSWNVRIANLSAITDFVSSRSNFPELLPVWVMYSGNKLLLLLATFAVYVGIFSYSLYTFEQFSSPIKTILWGVTSAVWGLMAADVTVTYITEGLDAQRLNLPIFIVNVIVLVYIAWKLQQKKTAAQT